ncbi:MAG: TrkH family potassium uptake protein [Candidatus Abyssobacteria bacterium SURF_17]|uniref:TrkH family potassium uptake protein n=1 Tax=Candidatus Abyssobacteria bacterium SURF_17 TaxID=2093361 RepID=A0A419F0I1_9BACT|nr:MAG: TrkH family potassium uptake protein [Candidatus Abyssubacteria bacterium SURF_17]
MRYREYIRRKYLTIVGHVGTLLLGVALFLLLSLAALIQFPEELPHAPWFVVPALITAVIGAVFRLAGRSAGKMTLSLADGGIIVLLSWTLAMVLSALPFFLSGLLNYRNALFESVSGWTTTGLSVLNVETTPNIFLLWRSLMQFGGGAGLAIVMLSAIVGPHARGLYQAEGRTEQLLPNVKHSANVIIRIYVCYTALGAILYVVGGMSLFDAVNHSLCALSTGGFSTRVASIGYYDSPFVEVTTVVLMFLGATNFATHYVLLHGNHRAFFRNGEVRLAATLAIFFIPVILVAVALPLYSVEKALRVSLFEPVSALTTTGYTTVSYADWSDFGIACLLVLMLIGGGICSTAGGIKQYRVFLLLKSLAWEAKRYISPATAVHEHYIWRGESKFYVDSDHLKESGAYFFLYLCTYAIGVLILLACGYSLRDSLFEFASALGTVGLSVGITAPNAPALMLWTEMAGMFLGRLEFFVIIYSLISAARDIGSSLTSA